MKAVLDTSVLIAREQGRPTGNLPVVASVSVMTLVELHLGVLVAQTSEERAIRLQTVADVEANIATLPLDREVGLVLAEIMATVGRQRRKLNLADAIIAATARRHGLPLYTQDAGFEAFPGVGIIRV